MPLETNNFLQTVIIKFNSSPNTVTIKTHLKRTILCKQWQQSFISKQQFFINCDKVQFETNHSLETSARQWACSTCTPCSPAVCDVIFFLWQTSNNDKAPAVQWQWTIWDDFTHESPKLDNTSQNKGRPPLRSFYQNTALRNLHKERKQTKINFRFAQTAHDELLYTLQSPTPVNMSHIILKKTILTRWRDTKLDVQWMGKIQLGNLWISHIFVLFR